MKIAFCGAHGTGKSTLVDSVNWEKLSGDFTIIESVRRQFPLECTNLNQLIINLKYISIHFFESGYSSKKLNLLLD